MKKLVCLTPCLYSDKCYSLSCHLMLLLKSLLDCGQFQIEIYSYDEVITMTENQMLENLDCTFLSEKVKILSLCTLAPPAWIPHIQDADILFCQHYLFSEILREAKKSVPDIKIISWIHSIVHEEYLSGAILYKNDAYPIIRQQNLEVNLSDICVFDSDYDLRLGKLDFNGIRSTRVIYLPTEMFRYHKEYKSKSRLPIDGCPLKTENIEILFIGRWDFRKGIDSLIPCSFRMYMEHGIKTVFLCNRGKETVFSDEAAIRMYQSLIQSGGLRFENWKLNKHEYVEFLSSQRWVCVFPSYYDPFNMAALDCAVLGLPMIVSNRCGVVEILHEDDGLKICNPYDREILYENIHNVCYAARNTLPEHSITHGFGDFQKSVLELFNINH